MEDGQVVDRLTLLESSKLVPPPPSKSPDVSEVTMATSPATEPPAAHPLDQEFFGDQFIVEEEDGLVIPSSSTSQVTIQAKSRPVRPPPSYTIVPLFAAQAHYERFSACGFVAILIVNYMLKSKYREAEVVDWWLKLGCWLSAAKEKEAKAMQTKNPNMYSSHVSPKLCRLLIKTTAQTLDMIEELTCFIHDPTSIDVSGQPEVVKQLIARDCEFVKDQAFMTLGEAIRRLFFMALTKPVAATFVSCTEYIHAIGIRWNADVPADKCRELREKLCPDGVEAYNGKAEPFLEELDEALNMEKVFLIDFYDSHLNNTTTGQLSDSLQHGSGIWIKFKSLCGLRDYLIDRYPFQMYKPPKTSDGKAEGADIQDPRKNSCDLVVWATKERVHDPDDINEILNSPYFRQWAKDKDATVSQMRTKKNGYSFTPATQTTGRAMFL